MSNSQLQLKDLSEKNAKALATSVTKFLTTQGITLQHTKALDLAGILCGFADWHGVQAAIVQKETKDAGKPIRLSFDDFVTQFKPITNTLDDNASADGLAFETYGAEFEAVKAAYAKNPRSVWTCLDGEGTMTISEGLHHVNRMFYFITKKPALDGRVYDIPYGHDEDDLCFEVSVRHPETGAYQLLDTIYCESIDEALERADIDYTEEVDGVVEEGASRIILVKQVKTT
jgi:hypothetical protein